MRLTRAVLLIGACAFIAVAGQTGWSQQAAAQAGSDWPMYRHDYAGTGYSRAADTLRVFALPGGTQLSVLEYEPAVVRLNGALTSGEGVTPDDEKITFPALELKTAVRVIPHHDDFDKLYEAADNVLLIQLVLRDEDVAKYRRLKGKPVRLTGTLFGHHTGHHYTKVLMTVQEIEPVTP